MGTYDLGAPVKSVWAGAPAGGTFAATITRPDGTAFTPAPSVVTGPPTSVEFIPDMAGRWLIRWSSTGEVGSYSDVANVWPDDPRFIISVDTARAALQLPGNTAPAVLDDIRLYIAAATPVIEDIIGPVVVRTESQTVAKGWNFAALYQRPVSSIVSIIGADATPYVVTTDYTFDAQAGMVTFNRSLSQAAVITYRVGTAIVPPNVQLATRELVRHWYQVGMQGQRSSTVTQPGMETWTPSGFAVPRRVMELCAPHERKDTFG